MSTLYRALDADSHEIRLLELLPGPFSTEIRCNLSYTTLQDPVAVPYEALSYVWGTPDFTEPIDLNGEPFFVTKNLATALRHLRPGIRERPRKIWVDAICINQNDILERNHQVTLMKDIYSLCTADLAWLGPDSSSRVAITQQQEELSLGFEMLKRLTSKDDVTLAMLREGYHDHHQVGFRSRKGTEGFLLEYEQQRPLDAVLLYAPLWSRIWVMQELALAPRVLLVAGFDTMEWDSIADFLGDAPYLDAFHLSWSHNSLLPATLHTFERAQVVQHQRDLARDCAEGKAVSTLMDVLGRFKFADATDPRDKIYGLLGLVSEQYTVKVNYSRPWHLVFADLCLYFIQSSGTLDIICQNPWTTVPLSIGNTQLPTWVADFTSKDMSGLDDGFSALLFAQRSIFQAGSKTCEVPCQTSDNGATLYATAVLIGTVGNILQDDYEVGGDRQTRSHIQGQSDEWFAKSPRKWMEIYFGDRLLDSTQNSEIKYEATAEPAFDAFWRTLIMDCKAFPIVRLNQDEIASDGDVFRKLLRFGLDEIRLAHIYQWDNEYDEEKEPLYRQRQSELSELQDQLISKKMWYRTFVHWTFTISENGLYCMLKKGARPGDVLAVLDGGKVPVVLRAVDAESSKYTFVGTAYVHGFMDGEARLAADEGKLKHEKILLV